MSEDNVFARLVSLACHALRAPRATVHGFATTLERGGGLEPPADRYVEMINAASAQLAELIDELSLAARIESDRYDPTPREADASRGDGPTSRGTIRRAAAGWRLSDQSRTNSSFPSRSLRSTPSTPKRTSSAPPP